MSAKSGRSVARECFASATYRARFTEPNTIRSFFLTKSRTTGSRMSLACGPKGRRGFSSSIVYSAVRQRRFRGVAMCSELSTSAVAARISSFLSTTLAAIDQALSPHPEVGPLRRAGHGLHGSPGISKVLQRSAPVDMSAAITALAKRAGVRVANRSWRLRWELPPR